MIHSISYKIGRDGMTAVIGPGASHVRITQNPFDTTKYKSKPSKHAAMQFFKAYWFEFGTKGVNRVLRGGGKLVIEPQPARPFMNPAFDMNKDWIIRKTQAGISATLRYGADG